MTCKYEYNGLIFNSEIELDLYLLFHSDQLSKLGDAAFKNVENSRWSELQNIVHKALYDAELKINNSYISEQTESGEPSDLDPIKASGDYKSITDIIHELKGPEGNPVFPLFQPENYWEGSEANPIGQKELFRLGKYDDPRIISQLPFLEKDLLPKTGDILLPVNDLETLDKIEKRMTNIWMLQAICGDLIHNIMADFFKSKTEDGTRLLNLTKEILISELNKKIQESHYAKYRDYISPEIIESTANAAIKTYKQIKKEYGEDCVIYSEKKVLGEGLFGTSITPVVGRIDLMVVSRDGKIGIFDFKCSPKDYTESNYAKDPTKYDPAKVLTFKYLLAAYRRLLLSIGIDSEEEIKLGVIPLKFNNFRFNYNTKRVVFDSIGSDDEPIHILSNSSATTGGNLYSTIESNLELIFPRNNQPDSFVQGDLLTKVTEKSRELFKVKKRSLNMSKEDIAEMIKEKGGIKKNKITSNWEFKTDDKNIFTAPSIKSKEEAEVIIFNKIVAKYEYVEYYVPTTTNSIRKAFKALEKSEDEIDFLQLATKSSFGQEDPLWILNKLKKYTDTFRYELISNKNYDPIFDLLGILLFKNKYTGLIDVIRISDYYDPTFKLKFANKNRTTILGTFLTDDLVNSDSNSQTLVGIGGNLELMETLITLNEMPSLFNSEVKGVGNIEVISPRGLKGVTATNELLLYNFKRLYMLKGYEDNFNSGKIKMVDRVSALRFTMEECLLALPEEGGLGKIAYSLKNEIKSCISDFDDLGTNPVILRQRLIDIDLLLTGAKGFDYGYEHLNLETSKIPEESSNPEYLLHRQLLFAIALLSGVNLLLLIEDHANALFISDGFLFKGVSGNYLDNPGTLLSKALNEFTDLVTKAYQNVRDNVIAFNLELRQRVEKLKASKNFTLADLYLAGNQVKSLYINMFLKDTTDLLFVNPWESNDLTTEEEEFLKFIILKINDNRIKGFDPSKIEEYIKNDPIKYLRVPLTKGTTASEVAVRQGWMNFIKARFAMLSPKQLLARLKKRYDVEALGFISDDMYKEKLAHGKFWEAINDFDATDGDKPENIKYRERILSDETLGGKAYFEHNLETLVLKHTSAYKMADELNNIFPTLRAITLNLNLQGSILNSKFTNDLAYLLTYVKTRIHNRPVEDRSSAVSAFIADASKVMMSTTSKLALAFNPRLWYQFIDGLWKDVTIGFKYLGTDDNPYTKDIFSKSWKLVMGDLKHLGNDFTMTELLNLQYGFNDMDANTYIDRIKTDNTGLVYNFWNVGFRFASRPDFYNRMTLFYCLMLKDGCYEAHTMKDGKLVYDWTKDKRYALFAKYKGNDSKVPSSELEEYKKLKSAYITVAKQFEIELAKYPDGTYFTIDLSNPKALPKAYTNQESESLKAISDRIYGYYAHEKKSLIHSWSIGALFMQMNTYWSAKKNQYAQQRSYTQEGKWIDYEEIDENGNTVKYCWKEDANGDLIPQRINSPEDDSGIPVKVWKGRPLEGIFVTAFELGQAFRGKSELTTKSGFSAISDILFNDENIDPEIRRMYNANIRQLFADLLIWLLFGNLLIGSLSESIDTYVKDIGNKNFGNASFNTGLKLTASILETSTDDANFAKSIFGRGKDWTPFAIKYSDRITNNILRTVTGKQDIFDAMAKSSGFGRSTLPLWDSAKIAAFDEKMRT